MHVVIVRLSALGDVVHALPALELLRAALPRAELTWVVETWAAPLLEGHPALDRVVVVERKHLLRRRRAVGQGLLSLARLRRLRPRAVIDLQGLLRSALVARAVGAERSYGPAWAREGARFLYGVPLDVPRPGQAHAVERYAALVRGLLRDLGQPDPGPLPAARLPQSWAAGSVGPHAVGSASLAAGAPPPPRLVLLAGAGKPANRIPPRLLAEVADRCQAAWPGLRVEVVGGPDDVDRGAAIAAAAQDVVSRCGQTTLAETGAALADAALVIGADTGCLHLARALGRPVLGLFPAADPARTGPAGLPGAAPLAMLRGSVDCAPCLARTCRRADGVRICLRDLPAARVAEAALSLLPPSPSSVS